jgi:hypothetical protein
MENLLGKWGWVSIDEIQSEYFKKYIHPEYLNNVESSILSDFVFLCIAIEKDEYLKLKSTEIEFLLKQQAFRTMPDNPKYRPLEKVKFLNSKGFLEFGVVKKISWHNSEGKHIYLLEVDGKMKSRRYYTEDLESNENN